MAKRLVIFSQPTPEVINKLKTELFPSYLKKKIFAFMPSEGSDQEAIRKYSPLWKNLAESQQANFILIDNSKRGNLTQGEQEKIMSANVLLISGGNTYKLLDHLRQSKLDKTIQKFWQKDNIVLSGFSAGAIVLSPSIKIAHFFDNAPSSISDVSGLNILNQEIWPHFKSKDNRLLNKYKNDHKTPVKTISDNEVLVIDK